MAALCQRRLRRSSRVALLQQHIPLRHFMTENVMNAILFGRQMSDLSNNLPPIRA